MHQSVEVCWYALRVKSRRERFTAEALRNKGYEEFLPLYRTRRFWADRSFTVELPLFSGYVFCQFDPNHRLPILTTPGVMQVVGMAGVPTPVDDAEIAAVQAVVKSGLAAQPWQYLRGGNLVSVERGPLRGLEGILIEVKNSTRLIISLTLLQRSVAVELDCCWVKPVQRSAIASPALAPVRTEWGRAVSLDDRLPARRAARSVLRQSARRYLHVR